MATTEQRNRFRALAGLQLPVGSDPAEPYTDDQADAYLDAAPACPLLNGGGPDFYGAAANAWDDKALALDVADVVAGTGTAPLVKQAAQGDASVTYAKPVPMGTVTVSANSPASMRTLANRLRRRSCNGGAFRSVDVAPPNVVRPGGPGDPFAQDYDGEPYIDPRPLILDNVDNPDQVINLPEPD